MEELTVGAGPHFVDDGGLKINKDSSGDVLPCAGFAEEGVESIISSADSFVAWHLAIRLQKEREIQLAIWDRNLKDLSIRINKTIDLEERRLENNIQAKI